ncbi:AMP-dependent synthetase/ligase [Streptomyces sp. NPDC090025]|uniref:AMP-dependent synthetase/ligase n=1 Tax=Streptomyces sp. NPDC090025 TaxID=3365922 RepID=UPI00383841D4
MSTAQHLLDSRPHSIAHLFLDRVAATPEREAYRYPVPVAGAEEWRSLTWAETARRVKAIAAGLLDLGLGSEERVAIASSTRVEWILADLGVMCAGAAATAIYPSTNADETAYILADSDSRAIFVENAEQLAKVTAHKSELPRLGHAILFDPAGDESSDGGAVDGLDVLTLAELERRGAERLARDPDAVEATVRAIEPEQLATLIYTSGTTGRPKGVRLVHDCWSYQAAAQEATGLVLPDDVQFVWLPLAHVFGKALVAGQVQSGHVMAVDGRIDRIVSNLPVVRPTIMASAPRVFEKVYNGVAARARAEGGARYKIFQWAARVARDHARTGQERVVATGRRSVPLSLAVRHAVADRLVYGKIRAAFGGALRGSASGAAALAPDIGYFFAGAGVKVLEGYGLTETSAACTVNPIDDCRVGTVGKPLPGTEVRIAEDGEILLRGPGVMRGYHNLPDATREALDDDGWFRTGDIGEVDEHGYVRITDRKKDLFKTSGGKYIAPTEIEGRFKALCPYVSNVLVIGDGRNYCTALIALDEAAIRGWAAGAGLTGPGGASTYAEIVASPAVHELVDGYVRRVNADLQRWQTVKKFAVLPRDLDVEHGELTPSLKVKRPVVEGAYADLVAAMYEGAREA